MSETTRAALLVEDNSLVAQMVGRQLQRLGYAVTCVETGRAAIELLATRAFDVGILDDGLPDIDGLNVVSCVRRFESEHDRKPVPIIMSSANRLDSTRCAELNVARVLPKPVSLEALSSALKSLVEPPPAASPIDFQELLVRAGNDRTLALEILTDLEQQVAGELGELKRLADEGKWPEVKARCHRLHGSLLAVAASSAARIARELETQAANSNAPAATRPLLVALDEALVELLAATAALRMPFGEV